MKIERHGHVVPLPNKVKARCGGPAMCEVCQREQMYEEGRKRACIQVGRQLDFGCVAVTNMLTEAFMAGAEWKREPQQ